MQCIVNDVPINYSDEGKGPVVLLLHGWRDSNKTFAELAAQLKKTYRVLSPDLPNFGSSGHSANVSSLKDYAEFVLAFLTKLKIKDVYAVLGHSMGGQIAIYGMAHNFLQPEKLILLSSAGVRNEQQLRKGLFKGVAKFAKPLAGERLKQHIYRKLDSDYDPKLPESQRAVLTAMLEADIQQDATKIKVPTLLIYGDADTSTPPEHGEKLQARIANSRLQLVPGGHHIHQDHADEVAGYVLDFLK